MHYNLGAEVTMYWQAMAALQQARRAQAAVAIVEFVGELEMIAQYTDIPSLGRIAAKTARVYRQEAEALACVSSA